MATTSGKSARRRKREAPNAPSSTSQTLKITKFLGRSENAVRIQIAVALIAFLLFRQLQDVTKAKHGFLELARLVRANLMHRKDVSRLRDDNPAQPSDSRQLQLNWGTT